MAVWSLEQACRAGEERFNRKARGLLRLHRHRLPVPESLILDAAACREVRARRLAPDTERALVEFVRGIEAAGHCPLFAIRCETKRARGAAERPHSLLNVGIRALGSADLGPLAACEATLRQTFEERARAYGGSASAAASPASEVVHWLRRLGRLLQELPPEAASGIIVQRMVFGCLDARSGNGICCNRPGEVTPATRFRGIFLPRQQGIWIGTGSWGAGEEVDLEALRSLHPDAYRELARAFDRLEEIYGPNRYLEFTIEGDRVFLLQHDTRQRFVAAGS